MITNIPGSITGVPSGGAVGSPSGFIEFDDFVAGGLPSSGAVIITSAGGAQATCSILNWRGFTVGAASAVTIVATGQDSTHRGVIELNTGTATTGSGAIGRMAQGLPVDVLGATQQWIQEWLVRVPTLSDGTNTYSLRLGWIQGLAAPTDGMYFEYSSAAPSSGNWIGRTAAASSFTTASGGTAVPVSAGQWYRLRIVWNGTTASFYADGVFIGSTTATIPSAAVAPVALILKSASVTARTALLDYYWASYAWSTPRAA